MKNGTICDIAILGAGASGLMAAIAARRACAVTLPKGPSIAILEKNEKAGKKLYATGNGRCNLLNRTAKAEDYRSGEGDAAGFAASVFRQCGPADLEKVFTALGLDVVEEDEGRLYPRSLQASSVVRALERGAFGQAKGTDSGQAQGADNPAAGLFGLPAELIAGFEAKAVLREADGLFRVIAADGRTVLAKRLILATGGKAGIQYGCDGRGLKIAEGLGHRIVRPIPALTGFICEDTDLLQKLAGVRVRGSVKLLGEAPAKKDAPQDGKGAPMLLAEDTGEIQFNKDSVSGICVMNVSGFYRRQGEERFSLELDFFPELDEAALAEKLAGRKEMLGDPFLEALLPEKLAAAILELAGTGGPDRLVALLKHLRFTPIASKGWKDAHTTSGGVALEEIDAKTLASKLVPGLYIAGEALDVDGTCGGYSLTWAFACGWTAGQAAARSLAAEAEDR